MRVVGFGAFKDIGGLVLGFKVGGERGRSANEGSCCLPQKCDLAQVAVEGGESGRDGSEALALLSGMTGLDRSGLGNAALDMVGDGGGEGVDAEEKNVGREQEAGDIINSSDSGRSGITLSID